MEIANGRILSGEFADELKDFGLKWANYAPLDEKWENNRSKRRSFKYVSISC